LAKRTAIIDIGSNSVRMVVFERTSRFAFHLLHEEKSRVRISENAYENSANLQEKPLQRAYSALKEFSYIIKQYKVNKTLCVATSALRDAPNKQDFIAKIKKELGINIKVIDGEKEALFGGIAVANLLYLDSAVSVDIGGGSTELAVYEKRAVTQTYSLKLGTVRLKELYFDNDDIAGAKAYIKEELSKLPSDFNYTQLVGIGGTLRAISTMVMKKEDVYFRKLHGYAYDIDAQKSYFKSILKADEKKLIELGVKKERLDVLQAGLLILTTLIEHIGAKEIITSGVGVREGVFLSDLLRSNQARFPHNYNPSVSSLLDRFSASKNSYLNHEASKLFDLCHKVLKLDSHYKESFLTAIKLSQIGKELDYYEAHRHSYYILLNGLNYDFSHSQIVLISTLVRYQRKKQPHKAHMQNYKAYLPSVETCNALSFLMRLCIDLFSEIKHNDELRLVLEGNELIVEAKSSYLLKEKLKDLKKSDFIKVTVSYGT